MEWVTPIHLLVSLNTSHSNRRQELLQQFYSRMFISGLNRVHLLSLAFIIIWLGSLVLKPSIYGLAMTLFYFIKQSMFFHLMQFSLLCFLNGRVNSSGWGGTHLQHQHPETETVHFRVWDQPDLYSDILSCHPGLTLLYRVWLFLTFEHTGSMLYLASYLPQPFLCPLSFPSPLLPSSPSSSFLSWDKILACGWSELTI